VSTPLAGMTPTGRRFPGPAADLVQVDSPKGLKCTAVVFHERHRDHASLGGELLSRLPFLEKPGVSGVIPLAGRDPAEGAFVYATGTVWSVAEVVRAFSDLGEKCGHRAGLELAYVTSQILLEGAEKGAAIGVFNHGSLSPWRLFLKEDGQVQVVGWGLPQVELIEHLDDETSPIKEDSYRYCPPERIERKDEDVSSDLFSLALIAVELMVGRPVYDGLLADVRQQAARAEGTYRLYRWREQLPATIRDALAPALKYDRDARHRDPAEFVYAVHDLLGSPDIEGPSLAEVVRRVKLAEMKGKAIPPGRTTAMSPDEIAAIAAAIDGADAGALPPPRVPRPSGEPEVEPEPDDEPQRWGAVRREGRRTRSLSDSASPTPAPPPAAPSTASPAPSTASPPASEADERARALRERLRRSRSGSDAGAIGMPAPPAPTAPTDEDPREALRRRLRERSVAGTTLRSAADESASPPTLVPAPPLPSATRSPLPPAGPAPARPPATPAPTSAGAPPPIPPAGLATSSGGAESLLARLRSSAGRRRLSLDTPASTPDVPRSTSPADPVPAAPPAAPTAPPPPVASPATSAASAWVVEVGGRLVSAPKLPGERVADLSWRLAVDSGGPRYDLAGRVTAGWRVAQRGRWWRGDESVDAIDAASPIALVLVPAETVWADITVDGDPPARLRTPLNTAVPASALVSHLVEWLGLAAGPWRMYVSGVQVLDRQLLADFEPRERIEIHVRR
jgi:hypothetical protein